MDILRAALRYFLLFIAVFGFCVVCAMLGAIAAKAAQPEFPVVVIGVTDGDTVTVENADELKIKVRLADIDCPELGQPHGKEAKTFTEIWLLHNIVRLQPRGFDRYGRMIATVRGYNSQRTMQEFLVLSGLAWTYMCKDKSLFKVEAWAKKVGIGMWSDKTPPVPPWEYRRKQIRNIKATQFYTPGEKEVSM